MPVRGSVVHLRPQSECRLLHDVWIVTAEPPFCVGGAGYISCRGRSYLGGFRVEDYDDDSYDSTSSNISSNISSSNDNDGDNNSSSNNNNNKAETTQALTRWLPSLTRLVSAVCAGNRLWVLAPGRLIQSSDGNVSSTPPCSGPGAFDSFSTPPSASGCWCRHDAWNDTRHTFH